MPKKKRSKLKYPSLTPSVNSRIRQEYMDYDYIDQLDDETKQYLEDFNREFYQANVGKQKDEGKDNRFVKGKKAVKQVTDENNHRNRDLYGRVRNRVAATKLFNYDDVLNIVEDELSRDINPNNVEDAIIECLDYIKDFKNTGNDTD